MKHRIKHVEMHIVHNCNLSCTYCTHYCDIGYSGVIDHEAGGAWIRGWAERMAFEHFYLLGGEPLLNPELDKYIETLHAVMPSTRRTVLTNGLLMRKIEAMLPLFVKTNTYMRISIHPVRKTLEPVLKDAMELVDEWAKRGLMVDVIPCGKNWHKPYEGAGADIRPYAEGRADESLANACGRNGYSCVNLHQGKLWKCPALAFLPMVFDKLTNKEQWRKFLAYRPLALDATDADIEKFIKLDSSFCDICPVTERSVHIEQVVKEYGESGNVTIVAAPRRKRRKFWRAVTKARKRLGWL